MENKIEGSPVGGILIEPLVKEASSAMYLPTKVSTNTGIIVAVPDTEGFTTFTVGTKVQFYDNAGVPVTIEDKTFLFMRVNDIIFKFNN